MPGTRLYANSLRKKDFLKTILLIAFIYKTNIYYQAHIKTKPKKRKFISVRVSMKLESTLIGETRNVMLQNKIQNNNDCNFSGSNINSNGFFAIDSTLLKQPQSTNLPGRIVYNQMPFNRQDQKPTDFELEDNEIFEEVAIDDDDIDEEEITVVNSNNLALNSSNEEDDENNVHIKLEIPIEAANLLKKLASENFYRLREIGILSVQLDNEKPIILTGCLKTRRICETVKHQKISVASAGMPLNISQPMPAQPPPPPLPPPTQPIIIQQHVSQPSSTNPARKRSRKTIQELTASPYLISENNDQQFGPKNDEKIVNIKENENSNKPKPTANGQKKKRGVNAKTTNETEIVQSLSSANFASVPQIQNSPQVKNQIDTPQQMNIQQPQQNFVEEKVSQKIKILINFII